MINFVLKLKLLIHEAIFNSQTLWIWKAIRSVNCRSRFGDYDWVWLSKSGVRNEIRGWEEIMTYSPKLRGGWNKTVVLRHKERSEMLSHPMQEKFFMMAIFTVYIKWGMIGGAWEKKTMAWLLQLLEGPTIWMTNYIRCLIHPARIKRRHSQNWKAEFYSIR